MAARERGNGARQGSLPTPTAILDRRGRLRTGHDAPFLGLDFSQPLDLICYETSDLFSVGSEEELTARMREIAVKIGATGWDIAGEIERAKTPARARHPIDYYAEQHYSQALHPDFLIG